MRLPNWIRTNRLLSHGRARNIAWSLPLRKRLLCMRPKRMDIALWFNITPRTAYTLAAVAFFTNAGHRDSPVAWKMTLGWQGLRMKRRFALSCNLLATSGARAAAILLVDWHGFMRSWIFGRFAVTGVVETVRPALRITGCKRPRKSSVSQLNILQPERRGGPYGQDQSAVMGWPPLQRCHLRAQWNGAPFT